MKKIKTILFDLGGVLVDYDRSICIESFKKIGYEDAENLLNPYKQEGIFLKLEEGLIEPSELHQEIRNKTGKNIDAQLIDQALISFLIDIPEYKLTLLTTLKNQGYKIAMLSNTNIIMMNWMRETCFKKQGLTIDDYFDELFLSYELKCVKPHKEIFEKMIALSGMNPKETLFIDDGYQNIKTASTMGFKTYLASEREDFRHIFAKYKPL